jgi:DNA polymerase-3 subunit delta'
MWLVVGNERTVDTLARKVADGRLPHALLLAGPREIGKTRLAVELAKALNCIGLEPPCQACLHCRQIEVGSHPDVWIVGPSAGRDSIVIQQVRELRESASLRAFQGKWKVFVIAGAEALTPQAADALLKTLEEPPTKVTIVLTTSDVDALPETMLSRCNVVTLQTVDDSLIERMLLERGGSLEMARRLAHLARGRVGWAIRAAADPKLAGQQEELLASLTSLLDLDLDARLQLVEKLTVKKDRSYVRGVLELLVLVARDLLYLSEGLPSRLAADQLKQTLARQAAFLGEASVHEYVRAVRIAMERVDHNVDPRLALEAVVVNLP